MTDNYWTNQANSQWSEWTYPQNQTQPSYKGKDNKGKGKGKSNQWNQNQWQYVQPVASQQIATEEVKFGWSKGRYDKLIVENAAQSTVAAESGAQPSDTAEGSEAARSYTVPNDGVQDTIDPAFLASLFTTTPTRAPVMQAVPDVRMWQTDKHREDIHRVIKFIMWENAISQHYCLAALGYGEFTEKMREII